MEDYINVKKIPITNSQNYDMSEINILGNVNTSKTHGGFAIGVCPDVDC